jgi:hypothetical protein
MTTLNDSNYESPTLDVEAQTSRVHSAPNPLSSPREPNHPSLEDDDSIIELGKGTQRYSYVAFNQADVNLSRC